MFVQFEFVTRRFPTSVCPVASGGQYPVTVVTELPRAFFMTAIRDGRSNFRTYSHRWKFPDGTEIPREAVVGARVGVTPGVGDGMGVAATVVVVVVHAGGGTGVAIGNGITCGALGRRSSGRPRSSVPQLCSRLSLLAQ